MMCEGSTWSEPRLDLESFLDYLQNHLEFKNLNLDERQLSIINAHTSSLRANEQGSNKTVTSDTVS